MSKRVVDVAIALFLAVPALVICVVSSLFIYAEMRCSPLFAQARVGRHQRPFTIFKMRTMPPSTPDKPSHEVGAASLSSTGRILRRLKIDELPQLWCVLVGDMSLVGPRPCLPTQDELISERAKRGVFELRPGITGLAQVRGIDMSEPVRLAEMDGRYAATRSLRGDLRLLIQTVLGAGRGDATS